MTSRLRQLSDEILANRDGAKLRYRVIAGVAGAALLSAAAALLLATAAGAPTVGYWTAGAFLSVGAVWIAVYLLASRRGVMPDMARLLSALIEGEAKPQAITDSRGRLIAANAAYRDLFSGRVPSPVAVMEDAGDAETDVAVTLVADEEPHQFNRRLCDGFTLWSFAATGDAQPPEAAVRKELAEHFTRLDLGWVSIDRKSHIDGLNPLAADMLGAGADDLIGQSWTEVARRNKELLEQISVERIATKGQAGSILLRRAGDDRPVGHGPTAAGFKYLLEEAPIGVAILADDGTILQANSAFAKSFGLDAGESDETAQLARLVPTAERAALSGAIAGFVQDGGPIPPLEVSLEPGSTRSVQLHLGSPPVGEGAVTLYCLDTSEQKALETQFVQAQKMQAVGQLAGGIAHDFNNLLTAIIGFTDLLFLRHGPGDESFSDLMQVKQNANRAANLVRQLLAFSRRQTLRPKVLDVTDVLAELSNLIRRLIGETIEFKLVHGRELGHVRVDQGQLEQVIINLAVNARDAMPEGGTLTIKTRNVAEEECDALSHAVMPAADYVMIQVADTGHGIDDKHIDKIFEPFFTTKEVGQGTGLGLSTVYGIVKQTGGFVFAVENEGGGARFDIYLPRYEVPAAEKAKSAEAAAQPVKDLTGQETILIVEDEDAVRLFAARALRNKGYNVMEANSGEAALDLLGSHNGTLDLLISDIVMPNMDGPTLMDHVRKDRPELKVILISGYAEDTFRRNLEAEDIRFLPKPFSLKVLAEEVREVLEGG